MLQATHARFRLACAASCPRQERQALSAQGRLATLTPDPCLVARGHVKRCRIWSVSPNGQLQKRPTAGRDEGGNILASGCGANEYPLFSILGTIWSTGSLRHSEASDKTSFLWSRVERDVAGPGAALAHT
jgi:hypothetical protein